MTTREVIEMVETLQADPWRHQHGFSEEMAKCHDVLFSPNYTRREKINRLASWLADFQPCLFGRMEAKLGRLSFCLLTENDLERSDQHIRRTIEEARADWRRIAFHAESHGFLIVIVDQRVAFARPNAGLHRLALKLCELYLGKAVSDEILHDGLLLRIDRNPADAAEFRSWKVGVNYFSAQGDGRWWHDHRIPGGMAFSMNSVGHMARSLAEKQRQRNPEGAARLDDVPREKLVYWALPRAMRTIGPQEAEGSRGTWLAPRGSFKEDKEPPTYEQRQRYFGDLAAFSENRYKGRYHTDHTIPSPYFNEALLKTEELPVRDDLYFTYLHDRADADYQSMGLGIDAALEQPTPEAGRTA